MDQRIGRIESSTTLDAASDADVVIEAVFERMDVKQQIFRALDTIAKRGAILRPTRRPSTSKRSRT